MRSVFCLVHYQLTGQFSEQKGSQKTDMHPVDLIWDSSIVVRQKFKFNGVPDAIKSL
jgi:hypothetical protein